MGYLFIGIAALVLLLIAGRAFTKADPARLAAGLRVVFAVILLAISAILALRGLWIAAVPLAGFALTMLGIGRVKGFRDVSGGHQGQNSRVNTQFIEMTMELDSGAMDGRVIKGSLAGQSLSQLELPDLHILWAEASEDYDSRAVLEAYLDSRFPGWRIDFEADGDGGSAGAASSRDPGVVGKQEAYDILGLSPGASAKEIRLAHRALMKRVHPDAGGSAFLAAKLNQAKDILLK